jgi:5-methylcytosine-specific restriction endonuclease McrA
MMRICPGLPGERCGRLIPASQRRCELHPYRWRQGSTREWRKTRERILARDGYRCTVHVRPGERCEGTKLLEVHHIYGEDTDVLLVPDAELRTVCRKHNPRGG